ncbi:hypothetical protein CHS0354_021160 [Potamilus streckersoni]|uniref:Uncharacterized protein n=1 Tax=Potamilus streckersoni TaxID=2493646 RepID=A0AAE0W668_9BIVA|nr:hypothetical protein CHS0354_021160 [Potamilus streckersoni]
MIHFTLRFQTEIGVTSTMLKDFPWKNSLQYVLTAGVSEAEHRNFMEGGGLVNVGDMAEYELGPHVHYDNIEDLLRIPEEDLKEARTKIRM